MDNRRLGEPLERALISRLPTVIQNDAERSRMTLADRKIVALFGATTLTDCYPIGYVQGLVTVHELGSRSTTINGVAEAAP